MLSDRDIQQAMARGDIEIDPFTKKQLQPASYDVRLGTRFLHTPPDLSINYVDLALPPYTEEFECAEGSTFLLTPQEFVLGVTKESIKVGPGHVARIEGKSGLGRAGLLVHVTAGFVDPGWEGPLTLELKNLTNYNLKLYPGMLIGQISFQELVSSCEKPYAGRHQTGGDGPVPSQFWKGMKR